jgi:DNA helicase MCM8
MQHAAPLNLIVNSLCPAIWGHELVKLGLCLALVGGVTKNSNARDKMPLRGDIHVLVVGDPGLGKSQLLRAVNTVSPRGVYVSGGYSTTAGLTVTVLKEKGTGDFVLEAGALVLGDQGIAAIDEFDKMRPQHAALLEAMEQQMISIAKAGIACSLPARTSVIAAANPVDGHFDHAKTVAENLCMAGPMLSRFDMIFLLLDRADATRDMMLSEHIMDIHGAAGRVGGASGAGGAGGAAASAAGHAGEQASLRDRLLPPAQFSSLPPPLLRKYICYVRRYVRPVLTPPAASVLKDCFLRLRAEAARAGADSIPVTTRTLEALVRLAEARAKIEGREQVTVADAYDVVELYDQTLPVHASAADAFDPAASGLPTVFNGGAAGETAARRQKAALTKELKMFAQGVRQFATRLGRKQFTADELRSLAVEGQFKAILADFSASLDQLNARGEFLKRRNDQSQAVEWQVL